MDRQRPYLGPSSRNGDVRLAADRQGRPFQNRKNELSIEDECILWGSRVVVPRQGRARVLEMLHDSHPGITKMKWLARSMVWWPGLDGDLEKQVQTCTSCQEHQRAPAKAPLHPWEWPSRPWTRVHIDYAGPFMGKMFLIAVDAHSKWLEVRSVPSATSFHTIRVLRAIFAVHGLPELLVSHNGSSFNSQEFRIFLKRNGIRQVLTAPCHPASNGLAERAVQTFKRAMKKGATGDVETKVARFLFNYRSTPHSTTGQTPAELLMGRPLRTHLHLMKPNTASRVQACQDRQKANHDYHAREREFFQGQSVQVQNVPGDRKWMPGRVAQKSGPLSYKVQLPHDRIIRRHVDHMRAHSENEPTHPSETEDVLPFPVESPDDEDDEEMDLPHPQLPGLQVQVPPIDPLAAGIGARRSTRTRKAPDRLICGL